MVIYTNKYITDSTNVYTDIYIINNMIILVD